jgi:GNAT superfamily N-acetyltransferase
MLIREAKPTDAAVVADFNLRLADETENLALNPATVRAGVEALLRDRTRGLYYVAESGGQVVGQLMITYEWSDWRNGNIWWLQSVYVLPKHRGAGVFRALFAHLEQLAAADPEVCTLRLYMHEGNATARRSYEKLGMLPTHYLVFEKEVRAGSLNLVP